MFKIGNIEIKNRIVLAPMVVFVDILRGYGCEDNGVVFDFR